MQVFHSGTEAFETALRRLANRCEGEIVADVEVAVREVLIQVRRRGDEALLEYTRKWDRVQLNREDIELPLERARDALEAIDRESRSALETAADRIRAFHARQLPSPWEFTDEYGNLLGQQVTPLDRVGVYVPGGKAAYPSSVLMNVLPAKVAGVGEIQAVTPPGILHENPAVLAALCLAEVDRIFQVGGAQAVAALAYGTETIPQVDKIVGPGNLYVATAKRFVFGRVDIDMVAGPSEVLIITDGHGDPRHLAVDLLAQAEHDELAVPLLVSTSEPFLQSVLQAVADQLGKGPWHDIASQAMERNGMAFLVEDLNEACGLANRIAPEHLELAVADSEAILPKIRHAGSIFLGSNSAESLGDYLAGPNHVLPTSGTARFFSPLGVYDFIKRSSILKISNLGLQRLGPKAAHLARMEGLHAHAEALDIRLRDQNVPCRLRDTEGVQGDPQGGKSE
jgi:histidinol dehydrogenase